MGLKVRGAWCGAAEVGRTRDEVDRFVARQAEIGINALFMNVKDGNGWVYWPEACIEGLTREGWQDFDLPAEMLLACEKHGVAFHAWFIDFFDGETGLAYQRNPQWAMLNAQGLPTNSEILRGERFRNIWFCPAQRPGYTDQWLVPLYREFASRYGVASLHHDYIRYPGDMAPDQYCFCDYCLTHIPKWCGYLNDSFPDEPFYHELYDRAYLEAHWEQSPRVLPRNWDTLDRVSKSRFLLEGGFFHGGRSDLDHFFYLYRTHWVTEFAKLSAQAVRSVNPTAKLSGAVFKNPIHSGRFIGQDWRTFAPWMEIAVPMDYRDHFPGDFEQYLVLLQEAIANQKEWAGGCEFLWIGVAINFLYKEEKDGPYPPEKVERVMRAVESSGVEGLVFFCVDQIECFGVREAIAKTWR
jgi:uncharacterized lipoprotein YddW (UPF0748 family)